MTNLDKECVFTVVCVLQKCIWTVEATNTVAVRYCSAENDPERGTEQHETRSEESSGKGTTGVVSPGFLRELRSRTSPEAKDRGSRRPRKRETAPQVAQWGKSPFSLNTRFRVGTAVFAEMSCANESDETIA